MMSEAVNSKHEMIADTVIRLASREGLTNVSLRNVANEAGISMGQVQYYFGTAGEMVNFAIRRALEKLHAFSHDYVQAHLTTGSALDILKTYAFSVVNDDADVAEVMRTLGQYESCLDRNHSVGKMFARDDESLQSATTAILQQGIDAGTIRPDVIADRESAVWWTIVGSLSVEVAMGASTLDRARGVIEYYLDRLRA